MPYSKPQCECGGDLMFWTQTYITIERDITKMGHKAKRRRAWEASEGDGVEQRLKCCESSCGKEYDIDFDDKDRYTRGDFRDKY